MSRKRRLLRLAVIVLVSVFVLGYGAFATFLFAPHEGSYDFDVSSLIPREVDFYLAKADLEDDFDPLPKPAFVDELMATKGGKSLSKLQWYQDLVGGLDVEPLMAQVNEALAQLPVQVDLLRIFGGRDLAVAGYFEGSEASEWRWAAYGRSNWQGKLAVELLRYPSLFEDQGLVVTDVLNDAGKRVGAQLSGGQITKALFVSRILDVVIVSSSPDFLVRADQLEAVRGENSFGLSAKYADQIVRKEREGDELEFFVDYRTLAEHERWPGSKPDPNAEDLLTSVIGRLFQMGSVRELMGDVSFGTGLMVNLHGPLSSELMTPVQKRLYRERPFDKARALRVAKLAPADSGLFLYTHADIGDLLRQIFGSLGDATRSNIDDAVRTVWGYADAQPLIDELAAAFKSRFALVVRPNDYPEDVEKDPPHNDDPVAAWALVLFPSGTDKIKSLRDRVIQRQADLGIKGREPGSRGVFENRVAGGAQVYEFWNELVPGTGHLATLENADYFVLSNSHRMLGHMLVTDTGGSESNQRYAPLSNSGYFSTLVSAGPDSGNLVMWINPRSMAKTTRALAQRLAEDTVVVDWETVRPQLERKILNQHFEGRALRDLSPTEEQALAIYYDEEVDEYIKQFAQQHVPALRARYESRLNALELVSGALVHLAIDQKQLDLFARIVMPLDE